MSPPQIIISSEEDISTGFLDEFQTALTRLGIPFETEQRERAVYMALEDHIPTALVVFWPNRSLMDSSRKLVKTLMQA